MTTVLAEASAYAGAGWATLGVAGASAVVLLAKLVPWRRNGRSKKAPPCDAHGDRIKKVEEATDKQWDRLDEVKQVATRTETKVDALGKQVTQLVDHLLPPALLLVCLLAGCADQRMALTYGQGHASEAQAVVRSAYRAATTAPAREQLRLADWHLTRSVGWSKAHLRLYKGPAPTIRIPTTREDEEAVVTEKINQRQFKADVDTDLARQEAATGWLGLLGLGGGALTGGGGILALLLRHKKVGRIIRGLRDTVAGKDRALDQYDVGVDRLADRTRRGFKGTDMEREHAARKT